MTNTADTIERLDLEARRLWAHPRAVRGDERQSLLIELLDVELELERLSLRADAPPSSYADDLSRCAEALDRLHHRWEALASPPERGTADRWR